MIITSKSHALLDPDSPDSVGAATEDSGATSSRRLLTSFPPSRSGVATCIAFWKIGNLPGWAPQIRTPRRQRFEEGVVGTEEPRVPDYQIHRELHQSIPFHRVVRRHSCCRRRRRRHGPGPIPEARPIRQKSTRLLQ